MSYLGTRHLALTCCTGSCRFPTANKNSFVNAGSGALDSLGGRAGYHELPAGLSLLHLITWIVVCARLQTSSPAALTSRVSTSSSTLTSPRIVKHTCIGWAAAGALATLAWRSTSSHMTTGLTCKYRGCWVSGEVEKGSLQLVSIWQIGLA